MTPKGSMLQFSHALGAGQFGVASAVRNRKGEVFCLKEIRVHTTDDEEKAEALREVQTMRECRHPNVVLYHDSWFERNRMYILMEYAPNGSLDKIIDAYAKQQKRFPENKVVHFVQELAGALEHCHELRIMHRDIKPANVLIDQLGTLKLGDFGLSKPLSAQNNLCTTFVGTPLYMSPEQCKEGSYSFPADMWSLGCVVFEIMALHSPWAGHDEPKTYPALVMKILKTSPDLTPIRMYSPRLVGTVRWMLRRDVSERATAHDIVDLLEMRAPPDLSATVYDVPEVRPEDTLTRRHNLVEDARRLAAAACIQRSFRVSTEVKRVREEVRKQAKEPTPVALKPLDRIPVVPITQVLPPLPDREACATRLQKALRTSLNRRRPVEARAPHLRRVPSVSTRLNELATPRTTTARPKRVPATPLPRVKPPKPAWV